MSLHPLFSVIKVASIAALRAIDVTDESDGTPAECVFYSVSGDQGGGLFVYDKSKKAIDNGGTVISGWVRQFGGPISVRWFGAKGDGATDDTAAIWKAIQVINDAVGGALFFPPGTYLTTYMTKAAITSTEPWADAMRGVTDLDQFILVFWGCRGLKVFGAGATIKTKNNGCPLGTATGLEWSQVTFVDCQDVEVTSLIVDGNRQNQNHTIGINAGHNHGMQVNQDCLRVFIHHCTIQHVGTKRLPPDIRGDAIYCGSGASQVRIENNTILDVGRWAFVLEDGPAATTGFYVRNNNFKSEQRNYSVVNPYVLGFIDIENSHNTSDVVISGNVVWNGCGQIAFGGNTGGAPRTVSDVSITDNVFNLIAANDGVDKFAGGSSGGSTDPNFRTFKNVTIANNRVTNTGDYRVLGWINFEDCRLDGATFCNNTFDEMTTAAVNEGTYAGVGLRGCDLVNSFLIQGNKLFRTGAGVIVSPLSAYTGVGNFTGRISNNQIDTAHIGIQVNNDAVNYGSSDIALFGNVTRNTTSLGASFVAGNVTFYDLGNDWDKGAMGPGLRSGISGQALLRNNLNFTDYKYSGRKTGEAQTKAISSSVMTTVAKLSRIDAARSHVIATFIFNEINQNDYTARLTFEAANYGGVWSILSKSQYASGGSTNADVTVSGDDLLIQWQKSTGGDFPAFMIYDFLAYYCDISISQ